MQEIRFSSSAGQSLAAYRWLPTGQARAWVVICHGLAEHAKRYALTAQSLCEHGFAVAAHDHLGHGGSAATEDHFGFFHETRGWDIVLEDLKKNISLARTEIPGIPVFLLGHSMGSFLARACMADGSLELAGVVLSGTAGDPGLPGKVGAWLAGRISKRKGARHRSTFLDWLVFGAYNARIPGPSTKFDWISRDRQTVEAYIADPACGFPLSAKMFQDFLSGLISVSGRRWFRSVAPEMPVYLIAGSEDPVGNYGKGVRQVYHQLRRAGLGKIDLRIYPGARHEIFQEINRAEVWDDLVRWLSARLS